ncbi:hypothetical protein [Candidatus Phytoplasma stylosanthis]|nr:hypothetical protein [Candidatus Phytoplasma stylosanthis]
MIYFIIPKKDLTTPTTKSLFFSCIDGLIIILSFNRLNGDV